MADNHSVNLTIAMRRDPALMDAVRAFVAAAPQTPMAVWAWQSITRHPDVVDTITRGIVYESALELRMPFHARRVAQMEVA